MTKTITHVLPFMRGVKVVQVLSAGVDAIIHEIPEGAMLCDGRGIHDVPVAEWVVGAMLSSLKYFQLYEDVRRREAWKGRFAAEDAYLRLHPGLEKQPLPILGEDLAGKHVLIVGYGSIGEAIERRLAPFDVTFTRVSRRAREGVSAIADLDKLLPDADIVILIVPLTPETEGMFNAARIAKMKQAALLVNAARGPVVDTDALVAALQAYKIRAALDVTDPEPLPAGHPLWQAPSLFLTPHIGGGGPKFFERAYKLAGEQVGRYMRGEALLNVVSEGY
jgi:phosphoglycerate dehydrogenase-like enzyme